MKLTAHAGQKDHVCCAAKALDENGNFTQENFQDRTATKEGGTAQLLELICERGRETTTSPALPSWASGTQKVETDIDLAGAEFTAHAVYSEMPVTGSFGCGNADVESAGAKQCVEPEGQLLRYPHRLPHPGARRLDGRHGGVHRDRPDPDGLLPGGGKMAGRVPPEPVPGWTHGETLRRPPAAPAT